MSQGEVQDPGKSAPQPTDNQPKPAVNASNHRGSDGAKQAAEEKESMSK